LSLFRCIRDIPDWYDRAMSGSDEHYRAKADECRQKAARTSSQIDKIAWLRLAEAWLALTRRSGSLEMTRANGERDTLGKEETGKVTVVRNG
jgi:hypothetical protein